MLTTKFLDPAAAAYAVEASAWHALNGHIPGDPLHDPAAWAAWRIALHEAAKLAEEQANAPAVPIASSYRIEQPRNSPAVVGEAGPGGREMR